MDHPRRPGRGSVVLPIWGLASAGGALGFFGGFWLLPADWHAAGVAAGILGGAVAGWLLGGRGERHPPGSPDAEPGAAPDRVTFPSR